MDNTMRIFVRRWNGATWEGLGGDGLIDTSPFAGDLSFVLRGNAPLVTWSHGTGSSLSVFVLSWTGSTWAEVGIGSASGMGVSAPLPHGFIPVIAASSTGTPTVAWVQALDTEASGQVYVRAFQATSLPDLTITALTAPATGRTGQTISVSSTVQNTGSLASPATQVRFYLAAGTERGPDDLLLGSRPVPALGVNGASTAATTLVITGAVEPGTWRVLGIVDEANTVLERNESNNVRVSASLTVTLFRPDLAITALTVPALAAAGRPLAITHAVRNLGPAPAGAFALRFYLSHDASLDGGDVLLGSRVLAALGAGASSAAVSTFTVPGNTSTPSTYRVIVVADALAQQAELDETNNVAVSLPLAITAYQPDLTLTALTLPATAQAGRPLAITHTVRNIGTAPAGAFAVRFLLSTSDTLDGTEVILGTRSLASLAAGASSSAVSTFVIPGNTPVPATYRVIAVADALGQQSELDETNNTMASRPLPITAYQPDLAITALSVPATGQAGRPLAITHTVRNAGPATATAFTVRFYLSADGVLDDGDVLLGTRSIGGLGAGASSAAVSTFTVPATTSVPASYRVIAVADALAQRAELDESNNLAVSTPLSLTAYRPDLTLTALTLPATAQAGRPLAIAHTVRNAGSAPAGAFAIRFYLSNDDTFDASDVLLGSRSLAALGAGVSSTAVSTFTVPANTSVPATYRVIARVDALAQQTELDETNNLAVSTALPVTPYLPDLVLATVSAPATVQAGHSLAIAHTVRNAGPAPAGAFAIRFFLSSDGALDGGDLLLGSRNVPSLGAGLSSTAVSAFIVPSTVPAGAYRVVAVVDALAQQTELDEAANVAVSGVVTVSP